MAQSGYDTDKLSSAPADTFMVEIGVIDDSYVTGDTAGGIVTHSVPTRFDGVIGGWNFVLDSASAKAQVGGCMTSQHAPTDHTYGNYIDFSMDATCQGTNNYILFGGFDVTQSTQRWASGNAGSLRVEVGCFSGGAATSQTVETKLTHVVGGILVTKDDACGHPTPGSTNAAGTVDFTIGDSTTGPYSYMIAGW